MTEDGPDDASDETESIFGFDGGERPFPVERPRRFRATVHGTLFERRERALESVRAGDALTLIPDPPLQEPPQVWVHVASGEPLGHLPAEIGRWLAPWLLEGGRAEAKALRVSGPETPSWRRLLLEVRCESGASSSE
ncbi:MAG: hypothetical protein EA351_06910 [Gemmatimonadales bacterium]|nr:MAG: hypothetical protein EA351_06910 [Gemmatimonadales bacterium]